MKNKKTNVLKRRSLLAIAFVAVIGFSMTACDLFGKEDEEETISLQGKWDAGGNNFYEFTGENFRVNFVVSGAGTARGTFTYTTTHITFNPTQYYYPLDGWVDWSSPNTPSGQFASHGIRGIPVTYRFEKNKLGVYLYIDGGNLGYKKQ